MRLIDPFELPIWIMILLSKDHTFYDMKLVIYYINEETNLTVQFLVFIQPYIQQQLVLCQIETVPGLIMDLNNGPQSYIHLQVNKPYIAVNSETDISLRNHEIRMCKHVGYELYCEELFMVKHKSKYSCESTIYFNLSSEIIKENCNSVYFNTTNIKPAVLHNESEIILANWPNDKHIDCDINNDNPARIPSFPYALLSKSVLCNFKIEADNNFILESLAGCQELES